MSSHLPTSLLVCWIAWNVFLMTPSVSAQSSTLFYNEAQLTSYARLSQQIRKEMYDITQELTNKLTTLQSLSETISTELAERVADARSVLTGVYLGLDSITGAIKPKYMPAINVWAPASYDSLQIPIYTDVRLAHGLSYNSETGEVAVQIPGIYQIQTRAQMVDYYYASSDILVYGPDGTELYSINHKWYLSCIPDVEVLQLEAGSVIRFSELKPYYSYFTDMFPFFLMPGRSTQVSILYLGAY